MAGEKFLALALEGIGLPLAETEFKFHQTRKWKFDLAWPEHKIALEIEGGLWKTNGGGHNRPKAFLSDLEKYNEAGLLGWRVFKTTHQLIDEGQAVELAERIFEI